MNSHQLAAATRPLYDRAMAAAAVGAWECRLANTALSWTDGVYDLFDLRRNSDIYRGAILDLYEEQSRREMERLRGDAIRTGQGFALDCRIRTASGEKRWMRLVVGVGYEQGRPARIFGSKQDVTAEKGLWREAASLARTEPPVALHAHRTLIEAVRQFLHERNLESERLAVAIFEIDGFRSIVESFGKEAGETLQRCVTERLKRFFPDALAVEQAAPGAFSLLLPIPGDRLYLGTVLDGTRRLLCRPISHGALVLDFTLSIGAALLRADGYRARNEIFAEAEAALHVAGLAGGNCVRVFDGPLTDRPGRR